MPDRERCSGRCSDGLARLNAQWSYWITELAPLIRNYACGDDDLTQEGLLALRGELEKNIEAPRSHLLRTVRYAVCNAYSKGVSVDSRKSELRNSLWRSGGVEIVYLDGDDGLSLQAPERYRPDVLAIDRITYEEFLRSLTKNEGDLLALMREGLGKGRAAGSYRDEFFRATGTSRWNYEKVQSQLRWKFYLHYGTEEELRKLEVINEGGFDSKIQRTTKTHLL